MSSDTPRPAGPRTCGPLLAVGLLALAAAPGGAAEPPCFQFTRLVAHWDQYADPGYLKFVEDARPEVAQVGFYGGHFCSLGHTPQDAAHSQGQRPSGWFSFRPPPPGARCRHRRPEFVMAEHVAGANLFPRLFDDGLQSRRVRHEQPLGLVRVLDAHDHGRRPAVARDDDREEAAVAPGLVQHAPSL